MSRYTIEDSHLKFLISIFGEEDVISSPEKMAVFGSDASREFALPSVVVRASSREQIQELLKWAHGERVPIIPRARATNMVGGCVPIYGGVVVSTTKLNRILEIDSVDFVAEVEPGVITGEFQRILEERGLFYPPDPASASISTIGGNVAQNAGGLRAVKYGVTRDYVLGMDVVIPGGALLSLGGRNYKDVVGLSLVDLFVGSEGTLGFFTRIILKLLPLPEDSLSILIGFRTLSAAVARGIEILKGGLIPVAMEFMDRDVVGCVRDLSPVSISQDVGGLLLLMFQGNSMDTAYCRKKIEEKFLGKEVILYLWGDSEEEEELWEVRRLINPASHKKGENKIAVDIAVPRSKVVSVVERAKEIGREHGLCVLTFGHLGDGNIHVNVMYGTGEDELLRAKKVTVEILDITLEAGGTVSGEHGVGIVKLPYIQRQLGRCEIRLMRSIKKVFDPHNIMNPGKAY